VPADDIPLAELPREVGDWSAVEEQVKVQPDGSYKMLNRVYERPDAMTAHLRVQATYTRLGSLRDWSLASMAQGWSAAEETTWRSDDGTIHARIERLVRKPQERIALTWYTSAQSDTASLKRAELLGAKQRLLGDEHPWASLYLLVDCQEEGAADEAVRELAKRLGPELKQITAQTTPDA
jgi:hypothetical protein